MGVLSCGVAAFADADSAYDMDDGRSVGRSVVGPARHAPGLDARQMWNMYTVQRRERVILDRQLTESTAKCRSLEAQVRPPSHRLTVRASVCACVSAPFGAH